MVKAGGRIIIIIIIISGERAGLCDMRSAHASHKCNQAAVQAGDAQRAVLGAEAHEAHGS